MFAKSRGLVIVGGTFTEHHGTGNAYSPLDRLTTFVAPNAFHNAEARYDPPRCHPDTRIAIRDRLHKRISGSLNAETRISWVYGPAGAGKSAILQTMAEECATQGRLLASFFLSRSDETRNHIRHFVSTICYQIIKNIPLIIPVIQDAIQHDPLIFSLSLCDQMNYLVVQPLQTLLSSGYFSRLETGTPVPSVIIVDGIDECSDHAQRRVLLHSIAQLVTSGLAPIITVLVSSRPEFDIVNTFNSRPMQGLWHSFPLDWNYKSDEDIRRFLTDSFREIRSTHPYGHHVPLHWPEDRVIETLVRKSSGQFIFSAVVVKYVSALDDLPPRRLEVVMGLRSPTTRMLPFAELDAMYIHLLRSHPDVSVALTIIPTILAQLIDIEAVAAIHCLTVADVELTMHPLSSIMRKHHGDIEVAHASFGDFLFDETRSGEFFVASPEDCHLHTGRLCAQYLNSGQDHKRDEIFERLLLFIFNQETLTIPWRRIASGLRMDRIWPMQDASRFYCIYVRRCPWLDNRHAGIMDGLADQIMPNLREQFKIYMSRPHLTAAFCLCILGLYPDRNTFRHGEKSHILPLTAQELEFDRRAFCLCGSTDYNLALEGSLQMIGNLFRHNGIFLKQKDFDITMIVLLNTFVRKYFVPRKLHIRIPSPSIKCCEQRYYGVLGRETKPRKWRTHRVYRKAGMKLYMFEMPRRHHDRNVMMLFYKGLLTLLELCTSSSALVAFIRSHMKYVCDAHPLRQYAISAIQSYLHRSSK